MPDSMTWLLTGGTGFFGKALLRHWIDGAIAGSAPPEVTVICRSPQAFLERHPKFAGHTWLRFHAGDILEPASLPKSSGFSHVLHAAADSTLGPRLTPLQRFDQIVNGTRHVLDFAVRCRATRFLLTSSGGVYGPQPQDMEAIPESYNGMPDPLNPHNAYSVGKRAAEHLCALYREQFGIETVVARCFAFIGCDLPLDVHFAIGNFVRDALTRAAITVAGDGTPVRSYMDQRDLARWLIELMTNGQSGEAYNVGSDEALTIRELAYLVRDTLAPGKQVEILGHPSHANFRNRYVPSIDKARTNFGLKLTHSLADALRATVHNATIGGAA